MDGEGDGGNAAQRVAAPAPQVFKAPRLVSRPKAPAQQEEEMGYEIKLGDFEDVHALSVSEARAVVTAIHEARKRKDPENNPLRDRAHNDNQYIKPSYVHQKKPSQQLTGAQNHHPFPRLP